MTLTCDLVVVGWVFNLVYNGDYYLVGFTSVSFCLFLRKVENLLLTEDPSLIPST